MVPSAEPDAPAVSIVVPVYRSAATLARSLESLLGQDFPSFEVIAVDSSPDGRCAEVAAGYPAVRYHHSAQRLLPHAARNLGLAMARGGLIAFTDPDIYALPQWLSRLVAAHRKSGHVVVGALECHPGGWLDRGIHWTKFSKWLPGGEERPVDMAPTAGLLCAREQFERAGGLPGDQMLGDVVLSWRLRAAGETLLFVPGAGAEHHHVQGLGAFVRERYSRGILMGRLEAEHRGAGPVGRLRRAAVSLLPVRLASNLAHVAAHARRRGRSRELLAVSPVVVLGFAASLLGEAVGALRGPALTPGGAREARSS